MRMHDLPGRAARCVRVVSPNLRRIAHEALDMVLDAWADDQKVTLKKTRKRPSPPLPDPAKISPGAMAKAEAALKRKGLV